MTLSKRVTNRLAQARVTPEDLPNLTLREITRIPGISTQGFTEIAQYVKKQNG